MNNYCRAVEPVTDAEEGKTAKHAAQCRAHNPRRARLANIKDKYHHHLRSEVNLSQRQASIKEKSQAAVFKDVDPEEIAEYKKLFPNLENISDRKIHCTTCNLHIGTAPINEDCIKMHPLLRVIQCKKCYKFCTSEEFNLGADGYECYCRWCGQGGEVYCCSQCPKVFCRCCIELNLSIAKLTEIQTTEAWICFACDSSSLTQLKADYWALMNFIAKQKKALNEKSRNETLTDTELNLAMRKDCSKCCTTIKFLNGKRGLPQITTYSNSFAKRMSLDEKRPTILNNVLAKRAESKIPMTLGNNDPPTTNTIIKKSPINYRVVLQSDSGKPVQPKLMHNATAQAKQKGLTTINGVQVDINKATQQETYRLKDGKLIKIRKRQLKPLPVNGSKISSKVTLLAPKPPKQDFAPMIITAPPGFIHQGITLNQPLFTGEKPKEPDCPAPTLIDRAKFQFELRVKNSLEVCQHITGKMKKLTNSTSFKSVKTQSDIKDLVMHLSYLLTYAGSRFKTIQEKCDDDLKVMGFDPDPNNSKSDDDDIEILEPITALIELDSDENDADVLRWETKKDVDNLIENKNVEPIKLELNEIVTEVPFIHQNDELIKNETTTEAVLMNSNDYNEIHGETNDHDIDKNSVQNKEGRGFYDQIAQSFAICGKGKEISLALVHYNEVTGKSRIASFSKDVMTVQKDAFKSEGLVEKLQPNGDVDTTPVYNKVYTSRSTGREQTDEDDGSTTMGFVKNLLKNVSCPLEIPEKKFQSLYRLSREAFKYLLDKIEPKFRTSRCGIPPILKLASTLRVLATGSYHINVGEVLNILDSCFTSFVCIDQSEEELLKCKQHYYENMGLPGVRGCIDGTHINIIRPAKNEQYFCNSLGMYSINVIATCDYKLLFTSVVANHGGCLTDSSIWSKSSERRYLENLYRNGNKSSWLLGDSDYPLEPWLMTPYKYAVDGTKEIKFNEGHSKCRETIKTCFSLLKSRFRCLSNAKSLHYKPEKAAQIIRVSCLLHNICIRFNVEFNESLLLDEERDKEDFNNTVNIRTSHTLLTEAKRIRDELSNRLVNSLHNAHPSLKLS